MAHARSQHPNAPLTPQGRRRMVALVLDGGWTIEATAERFQVDAKTVRKWRDRFLAEGDAGLFDRSVTAAALTEPDRRPGATSGAAAASHSVVGAPTASPMRSAWRPRRCSRSSTPQAVADSTAATGPAASRSSAISVNGQVS